MLLTWVRAKRALKKDCTSILKVEAWGNVHTCVGVANGCRRSCATSMWGGGEKIWKEGGFLENVISLHKKVAVSEVNPVGRDAFGRRKTTGRPDAGRCAGRSDIPWIFRGFSVTTSLLTFIHNPFYANIFFKISRFNLCFPVAYAGAWSWPRADVQ